MKTNKNWSCPKKQKARMETIIAPYRKYFGNSLPKEKQYWTMSGQCATIDGKPLEGCELSQVLHEGVISENQFRGVEIKLERHNLNVKAYPNLMWYNSDFYRALAIELNFNAGVVNADLLYTPEKGTSFIGNIMQLLTDRDQHQVLFVANFIVKGRYYKKISDYNYVIDKLSKDVKFQYAMNNGEWKLLPECYTYCGTGSKSKTDMASYIFVKK